MYNPAPKPRVISIAAVSGGGKTTITRELARKLDQAKALYFDDYEFEECPSDICDWVERGADCNEWNISPLIHDVQLLLHDPSIHYVVLDYPFAYLHEGLREFIDVAVYIDTSLDIAMARRIVRDFAERPFNDLRSDLTNYLVRGRPAYLNMERTVKPSSDLVVEGDLPVSVIVDRMFKRNRAYVSSLFFDIMDKGKGFHIR